MKRAAALCLALLLILPTALAAEAATPVTRGDFLMALWEHAGGVSYDVTTPFTDVEPTAPCSIAVGWACGEGLVLGVGGQRFAPDRPITREEAAVLLRRYAERLGHSTFLPDGLAGCNDEIDTAPWSGDDLYWACDAGLLLWSQDGRLDPHGLLTAEDIAEILARF